MTEAHQFERVAKKAIDKLEEILNIRCSESDLKTLNMQKEAAVSVLNLAIKADEARFRKSSESGISAILREVKEMQANVEATPLLQ